MIGRIFDIKEFGVHDGPGLVTTVFFKGCPLRCVWCHNPEGQSIGKELMFKKNLCKDCGLCMKGCSHEDCKPFDRCVHICPNNCLSIAGKDYEAKELAEKILRNRKVLSGVTFSGGEPLMQGEFLLEVMSYLDGIDINIETCGYCDNELFERVVSKASLIYFDMKLADDDMHRKYTGVSNKLILDNLNTLKQINVPCIIRTPLIEGITDTKENLDAIKELIGDMRHELLPYNRMAGAKYGMLDRTYPLDER